MTKEEMADIRAAFKKYSEEKGPRMILALRAAIAGLEAFMATEGDEAPDAAEPSEDIALAPAFAVIAEHYELPELSQLQQILIAEGFIKSLNDFPSGVTLCIAWRWGHIIEHVMQGEVDQSLEAGGTLH